MGVSYGCSGTYGQQFDKYKYHGFLISFRERNNGVECSIHSELSTGSNYFPLGYE